MKVILSYRDGVQAIAVDLPALDCAPEVVIWNERAFVARESRGGVLAFVESTSLRLELPAGASA